MFSLLETAGANTSAGACQKENYSLGCTEESERTLTLLVPKSLFPYKEPHPNPNPEP